MTRPRSFLNKNEFYGEERTYTRQRLYRKDDGDFNAALHAEPLDKVRAGIRQKLSDLDEDPYAEAGYVGIEETDAAKDQFRSDVAHPRFRNRLNAMRSIPGPALADNTLYEASSAADAAAAAKATSTVVASVRELRLAREREARTRAEIIRAMERSQTQRSLFTVDYARCVPEEYAREFLSGLEASTVCDALVPMLNTRTDRLRYHMEEGQLRRVMFDVGTHFERGENIELLGHLRDHAPLPPQENGWYTPELLRSEHVHYDADANTTSIRVLNFLIPTSAADADGRELLEVSDAAGYRVKVVCHLVEPDTAHEEYNVLCFRTFYFSRYL